MTLGELKNHFEQMENGKELNFKLSTPFSWRGIYAECAFSILKEKSTKEENLEKIEIALLNVFQGWKGGDFKYDLETEIHFESEESSWTDGGYSKNLIEEIKGQKPFESLEHELVEIAFI
jgi:hypothetical protein